MRNAKTFADAEQNEKIRIFKEQSLILHVKFHQGKHIEKNKATFVCKFYYYQKNPRDLFAELERHIEKNTAKSIKIITKMRMNK